VARGAFQEMSPWRRRPLTIPPNSWRTWMHLVVWELWMGMRLCLILSLGVSLIAASPDRIIAFTDLSHCYRPPPVALPCEQIVYRGGMLNAAFTALFGIMLIGLALWLLWELWTAVAPKPIADDFLRLLHDSFARDWRNPLTWPWARVLLAYGFTAIGAAMTAGVGLTLWTLISSSEPAKVPTVRTDISSTSQVSQ
jgi:hypothetical protein